MESTLSKAEGATARCIIGAAVASTVALAAVSANSHAAAELLDAEIDVTVVVSVNSVIDPAFSVAVVVSISAVVGAARAAVSADDGVATVSVLVEETSESKLAVASCAAEVPGIVCVLAEGTIAAVGSSSISPAACGPPGSGAMVSVAPALRVNVPVLTEVAVS